MKGAYHRLRFDDARIRVLDRPRLRTMLPKSKMGPILIIVMHVFREYALQIPLIENDGLSRFLTRGLLTFGFKILS